MFKSRKQVFVLLMIVAVFTTMLVSISISGVKTSKHDLSTTGTGPYAVTAGTDQVCVFCHTPHFATTSPAPLWNRTSSAAVYTMYTSPTIDMTIAGSPQGVSAACLSCHDGTVAFDSLVNKPGSGIGAPVGWTWGANGNKMTIGASPAAMLGTDLTNDHPISITYDTTKDTAFVAAVAGKVGTLPLYGGGKNQVECGTCHNPHDNANSTFLRATNAGSALCLTCHVK